MSVSRETRWYCLRCGNPASFRVATLDVDHPLITCSSLGRDGIDRGCGRTLGTSDESEASAAAALIKRNRAARKHEQHVLDKRRHPQCPLCLRSNVDATLPPHSFERIDNKHRLAHHLDRYHAQGDGTTMVVQRPITELFVLHRELHEAAAAAQRERMAAEPDTLGDSRAAFYADSSHR